MLLANGSKAVQRAIALVALFTSCPSAVRRETEAELEEAAAHPESLMQWLETARTASRLVDKASVTWQTLPPEA